MDELVKRLQDFAAGTMRDDDAQLSFDAADAIEKLLSERDEVNADSWKTAFEVERDEHRWIPVTERLPKLNENVLVYSAHSGLMHIDANIIFDRNATHWMPLPPAPKEET